MQPLGGKTPVSPLRTPLYEATTLTTVRVERPKRSSLWSLSPLFKSSEKPNNIMDFSGARKQFWQDALHAATNDS